MKGLIYKVTIKEEGKDTPLTPHYAGRKVTREFLIDFFGLDRPEVEWYEITEMFQCCVCGKFVPLKEAHNAAPIADDWCCTECIYTKVIPARIAELTATR